MKKVHFTVSFLAAVTALVCIGAASTPKAHGGEAPLPASKEISLSNFGIPVTIAVPEGAEVKKGLMSGEMEGVKIFSASIRKDRFIMEVNMWDEEPEESLEEALDYQKSTAEEDESFDSYALQEPQGFIYKTVDEGEVDYDFVYILEKDSRHILFTQGISLKGFTEAEAKAMYSAAKAAK